MIKVDHQSALLDVQGVTKSFAGVRPSAASIWRSCRARCTASSARTARASRRSSRCSPASTAPTKARSRGSVSRSRSPPRSGDRARHRDDVPGARRRRRTDDRREHLPRPRDRARRFHAALGGVAKQTRELLQRLGHANLSPNAEVGQLSAANKQIVSMARALSHDIKLIIMDEPSAVLDSEEVKNLFHVVQRAHRPRASPSSTSPTASRRSARSATASRCSRTAAPWRAGSPSPTRRPPSSSADDRPDGRERLPARGPRARGRARRARGGGPRSRGRLRGRLVLGARRRGRRPRRTRRLRAIRDPRDGLRRAALHRRHACKVGGKALRRGSVVARRRRRNRPLARRAQEPGPRARRADLRQRHALVHVALRQGGIPRRACRAQGRRASRSRRSSCVPPTPTAPP